EFGSLQDLINHKKSDEIGLKLRVKMMIDGSKGITYLHENGILHRDIKPDNFLVFSIELNDLVNAKLTDFGSSRNINLLMTNMTVTKGIGTPVYMAPEILRREKYKKPADVYSFAVTMYQTFKWKEPYPINVFEHSWDIANFIVSGERLERPKDMREDLYLIISESWCGDTKLRNEINDIQHKLETVFIDL
ncbi:protein serine/threonine kinase, putative, partial [Entamoeba invadens IP1]